MKHRADINKKNNKGKSLFLTTLENGHWSMANYLTRENKIKKIKRLKKIKKKKKKKKKPFYY